MRTASLRANRPLPALVAVAEVLAAALLAGLVWWCWDRGVIVTVQDGVTLNRIEGAWWAVATALATLAGMALLDAVRRMLRSIRPPRAAA